MLNQFTDPNVYEIMVDGNERVPVEREVFRSWTGRRFMNGEEHHGPIFSYLASEEIPESLYKGKRECTCSTCLAHVDPRFKPN